jgi:hypothetical protein
MKFFLEGGRIHSAMKEVYYYANLKEGYEVECTIYRGILPFYPASSS